MSDYEDGMLSDDHELFLDAEVQLVRKVRSKPRSGEKLAREFFTATASHQVQVRLASLQYEGVDTLRKLLNQTSQTEISMNEDEADEVSDILEDLLERIARNGLRTLSGRPLIYSLFTEAKKRLNAEDLRGKSKECIAREWAAKFLQEKYVEQISTALGIKEYPIF